LPLEGSVERRIRLPSHTFDSEDLTVLTADALTADVMMLPGTPVSTECSPSVETWVRRGLTLILIIFGGLLTLWIVSQLGPVAYGLPAPFFRRAAAVPNAA
jgi:hypothetical protein